MNDTPVTQTGKSTRILIPKVINYLFKDTPTRTTNWETLTLSLCENQVQQDTRNKKKGQITNFSSASISILRWKTHVTGT